MLNKLVRIIWSVFLLFVFLAVFFTALLGVLPLLLVVAAVVSMLSIPYYFGGRFSFEGAVSEGLDRIIGNDSMRQVRDDLIMVYVPYLDQESHEKMDRWSLLREIDRSQQEVKSRLKAGESIFAFLGGAVSVIVVGVSGYTRLLSVFLLFLFLAVTVRVTATDILAFCPIRNRHLPTAELAYLTRWNAGPVRERGAMLLVFLTLFLSILAPPDSRRYNTAMDVLSQVAARKLGGNYRKWHAESESAKGLRPVVNKIIKS
jgi:hypothetical protein